MARSPDFSIALLFAEFRERGVSLVKELSFIDDGLWGFEITDADGVACPERSRMGARLLQAPHQLGATAIREKFLSPESLESAG